MATTIEVTAEDIAEGYQCDSFQCPIALALKRAGFAAPTVGATCFSEGDGEDIDLPEQARDFVFRFDGKGRGPIEPFSFTVNADPS